MIQRTVYPRTTPGSHSFYLRSRWRSLMQFNYHWHVAGGLDPGASSAVLEWYTSARPP